MVRNSERRRIPMLFVEGKFDARLLRRIYPKSKMEIKPIESDSNNKQSLIELITSDELKGYYTTGLVDADSDFFLTKYLERKILPYHKKLIDTSPASDMNILVSCTDGVEDYIRTIISDDKKVMKILQFTKCMGILRALKRNYEIKNNRKVVLKLNDTSDYFTKNRSFLPTEQEIIGKLKSLSEHHSSTKFFKFVEEKERYQKVKKRIVRESIDTMHFINGHDLSRAISVYSHRLTPREVEALQIKNASREKLSQYGPFSRINQWITDYPFDP